MKGGLLPISITAFLLSATSNAALVMEGTNCKDQLDTFQLTNIVSNTPPTKGQQVGGLSYPINSTNCLGYITSPDNDWGEDPSPNKGALRDGLLNEQFYKHGNTIDTSTFVPGEYFLTNEKDSLVDVDGDGVKTDPGWIRLGGVEANGHDLSNFQYDSIGDLKLGGDKPANAGDDWSPLIDISFMKDTSTGSDWMNWTITVSPDAIQASNEALGRSTFFDHLAFVVKGPNDGNNPNKAEFGEWAIYDFNFHDLIDDGLDISLQDTAYVLSGRYNHSTIFGGQDLSHLSVWAHDPPTSVNEPATIAFMLIGFLALFSLHRKKSFNY